MKIDDSVIIPCPKTGFNFIAASNCVKCEFYMGLMKATINGVPVESENIDDYQISCGRPITRRMHKVIK